MMSKKVPKTETHDPVSKRSLRQKHMIMTVSKRFLRQKHMILRQKHPKTETHDHDRE